MLDLTTNQRKQLDEAQAQLIAIEDALIQLATAKSEASASPAAFNAWRNDHDAKTAERERLQVWIETLEREVAASGTADRVNEVRKKHAAKLLENAKLAQRIRSDLERAEAIMLPLIRDVAQSAADDQALNVELPDGLEPLVSADQLARSRPMLEREEVSRQRVALWARSDNRALIGDQGTVRDLGGGYGIIERPHLPAVRCVRMEFEQVAYRPSQPAERARPLWQILLMMSDGPRPLFDGTEFRQPREVLAALDRASAPREKCARPIETEIRPLRSAAVR
ncbi:MULTISPECIES: hypothetical protein [unclassified Bradyrhizobium]|uniref:hypothetical protein n=1 Tax=unclassified Bradyrhizobium TaxID=2631580 RepID=UPI0028F00A59|nr:MULTISPECIES: hypothetical protein [unclassified Bradyrhizobium]